MKPDPYAPPETDVRVADHGPERPVRGILGAFVIDIAGTWVAIAFLSFVAAIFLLSQGYSETEVDQILMSEDPLTLFNIFTTLVGLTFSFWSGYLCIRFSRGKTLRYAYILVAINIVLGVVVAYSAPDAGLIMILTALGVAAVLLGARFALNRSAAAS